LPKISGLPGEKRNRYVQPGEGKTDWRKKEGNRKNRLEKKKTMGDVVGLEGSEKGLLCTTKTKKGKMRPTPRRTRGKSRKRESLIRGRERIVER